MSVLLIVGAAVASLTSFVFVALAGREGERYERDARFVRANIVSHDLASAIACCADRDRADNFDRPRRALPPQSRIVPATLPDSGGFQGTDEDWRDAVFRCAAFRPLEPVHMQVQWSRTSPTGSYDMEGELKATVDLNLDGLADKEIVTEVACSATQCTVAPNTTVESLR